MGAVYNANKNIHITYTYKKQLSASSARLGKKLNLLQMTQLFLI